MKRREERERIERERQASFFASLGARDGSEGNDGRAASAPSGARGDSIFGGYFSEEGGGIGGLERGVSTGLDGGKKNERPLAQESRGSDRGPRDMEGFKGREGVGGQGQGVPRQGQRQRREVGGRGGYARTFGEERESERRSRESKAWTGAGISVDDGVSASARGVFSPAWKASLTGKVWFFMGGQGRGVLSGCQTHPSCTAEGCARTIMRRTIVSPCRVVSPSCLVYVYACMGVSVCLPAFDLSNVFLSVNAEIFRSLGYYSTPYAASLIFVLIRAYGVFKQAKAETKGSERLPRQGGLGGDDRGEVVPLPRGLDISIKE